MIQRIQSIYLLIASILGSLLCVLPILNVGTEYQVSFFNQLPYAGICLIVPLVSFVSIFIYKKRILQMRINSFNIVLIFLQIILVGIYVYFALDYYPESQLELLWPSVIPLIEIILSYLAIREIGKDEALVRSADRLR